MRVDNLDKSFNIGLIIFALIFSISLVLLIVVSIPSNGLGLGIILLCFFFSFMSLALALFTIFMLGYNVIDGHGITRHFLLYKKHYKWNDLMFISKARVYGKNWSIIEKIIVSVNIPKEKFTKTHTYRMFSKKCFYIPYSKKLEDYLIAKAPINCYTYSYIVDDTMIVDDIMKKHYK